MLDMNSAFDLIGQIRKQLSEISRNSILSEANISHLLSDHGLNARERAVCLVLYRLLRVIQIDYEFPVSRK